MVKNYLELLKETLEITEVGRYVYNGASVSLKEGREKHQEAIVLTEEEIRRLKESHILTGERRGRSPLFSVSNRDSYEAAIAMMDSPEWRNCTKQERVLVLNFANPVNPGGGVRWGAKAQEEDLCRRSTLLISLESKEARKFYDTHRKLKSAMASDAVILSPSVEIFRNGDGSVMEEPVTVSVLTCAAPAVSLMDRMPDRRTLEEIFYQRIQAMLHVACEYGYRYLVLGAWGCGAFGNDAGLVAEQFARAFREFCVELTDGSGSHFAGRAKDCFCSVEFAVLDKSWDRYNYQAFYKVFGQ